MTNTIKRPTILSPDDLDVGPAPAAKRATQERTFHGKALRDDYGWLRDPGYPEVKDPDVLDYLNRENDYFASVMNSRKDLTQTLFEEMKGRIKEDDSSVPIRQDGWMYQWRFDKGEQYKRWYRWPEDGGPKSLVLDEPALAADSSFFRLGGFAVSFDGRYLAWSADVDGSERYVIRVKDLESGQVLPDIIPQTIGTPVWSSDSKTLLYAEINEQWRPFRVRAHRLGGDPADDTILYEESDPSFFVGLGQTQSRHFIVIGAGDHVTSEVRLIPSSDPYMEPLLVAARRPGVEYDLDHAGDRLFIRTNDTHQNFRIVAAPLADPAPENWAELIAGSDNVYIRGLNCFAAYMAITERVDGLDQVRIRTYVGEEHRVNFPEATYTAGLAANSEFDPPALRLAYSSMVTPGTVYDYDVDARHLTALKVQEIPSGYDASRYRTERLMAPARDGTLVPVSIVYPSDFPTDGSGPVHLYGYGAYGIGMSPSFSTARLSLLDRGFAYAIAHIRGGDELGYGWYQAGKAEKRLNTFHDFIDVGRHLVDKKITSPGNISISGGSAGGKLMGAVLNMAPEMWRAAVAHVPFVDVLNTMLDETLPLTPIEWPEWGNPLESPEVFDFLKSYSPYDQVSAQDYPPIMITCGLNDPRVTYWEPAKWAAKLRATKTDDNLLLLKTNMGAGHGGKSGRFEALEETAEEYTFILMAFGRA